MTLILSVDKQDIPAIMLSFYKRKGSAISLSEDVYDTTAIFYR
jgi:hypothetical protein